MILAKLQINSWLKKLLSSVLKRKLDNIYLFYQLLFFAQLISFFTTDIGLLTHALITVSFWLKKNGTLDSSYLILTILFSITFFIPALMFNYWNLTLFQGALIRILCGYLVVRSLGENFIELFHNQVIILALISLIFYFVQVINPNSFYNANFLKNIITPGRADAGHVNFLVFHFSTSATMRNSGFMWEPAAFGAVLAWALTINIYKYRFHINKESFVLVMAMLSTISIGTYTYLTLCAGLYFINKKNMAGFIIAIITLGTITFSLSKTTFVQNQVDYLQWKASIYQNYTINEARKAKSTEVPRTTGFLLDLGYFIKTPTGYGFYRNQELYPRLAGSPCGLSRFFVKWGVAGLIALIFGYNRYLQYLSWRYKFRIRGQIFFVIIFLLTLFGNPIDYAPFMTVFFLFGLNARRIVSENKTNRHLPRSQLITNIQAIE